MRMRKRVDRAYVVAIRTIIGMVMKCRGNYRMLKSRTSATGHPLVQTLDLEIALNPSLFIAQFRLLPGSNGRDEIRAARMRFIAFC